jgi:hypothetical protein
MREFASALLLTAAMALVVPSDGAQAAGRHSLRLACENGRNYPVHPKAVSDEGDLVTGFIRVRRHNVPIRLVPMGEGYRYAGRGIWFDGVAGDAVLNWGTRRAVSCSLQQG